ncbi:MAG: response regulator [Desulfobacterales bacterium]|nr:response regulator [Desulfobacterales bacterium]
MSTGEKSPLATKDQIKLLLIDDEVGYVDVLANRLSKRNISVTKAYSGTDAMHAVRNKDFDVAILDLKMEDMDGLEVLKIFKQMGLPAEVIMLTGHGSQTAAKEGIQLGAFDYLTKPCELHDLIEKIQEAYQKRKKQTQSSS